MKYRQALILIAFVVCSLYSYAQNIAHVSVNADSISFKEFVHIIEAQTGYYFYYDASQLDSFKVTVHAQNETVSNVLSKAFSNTPYFFSFDDEHHIFITSGFAIQTKLPDNFFAEQKNEPAHHDTLVESIVAQTQPQTKEKLKSSIENKLFEIGSQNDNSEGKATISGYIKDAKTGEPVAAATVYNEEQKTGASTDQYGYYSLSVSKGRHVLKITSIGMTDTRRNVLVHSNGTLNVEMHDYIPSLKSVTVSADKTVNIRSTQMGVTTLNIKTIKQIPTVLGEADVLRAILTLPGVTSVGESSTGYNVRGGAASQNLILLNDATVFNPSHFFGFFSAFNPDVIKDAELFKSSIPEKYGGRLSSVLNVTAREGNKNKFAGNAGIGPVTSRITLEGPIDSGKTSFIIGARTTYSDWLLRSIHSKDYGNSSAGFTDANLLLSHQMNANNSLYINGYYSKDRFRLNGDTLYRYSNANANIKWKHIFNNKFSGVLTAGTDRYEFSISSVDNVVNAYKFNFDINQFHGRFDFDYALNDKHDIDFGITSTYYKLHPGSLHAEGKESLVAEKTVQEEQALESALYIGYHYTINKKLSINAGLRFSFYNYLGPHKTYNYAADEPRQEISITDSTIYEQGKLIKTYMAPEVRLSARYILSDNSSFKVSVNRLQQFIHTLSNTTAIAPTDVLKLSDTYIRPQRGLQYSAGYYHNFKSNTIETSVEVYYKTISNYLDYKSGATLILNQHIETDVVNAKGKAYGAELLIRKTAGKLNGWLSYTYSRTFLKTDDALAGAPVNRGELYPADYDKPNVVNFIGNYRFSHRFSVSLNLVYSTGRPITLPVAEYYYGGGYRVYYSDRNKYRIPDYFRSDFSMNIEGNHKVHQFFHNSFTIGVYNVTARKNAYSVYFTSQSRRVTGYKLSIFGTAIPFVTYNVRF